MKKAGLSAESGTGLMNGWHLNYISFGMVINSQPLADRMRSRNFAEFFGQEEIVGKGKLLRKLVESDELSSLVFWGPPGVGKTTLVQIIANQTHSHFVILSAVESGKEELRKLIK